MIFSDARFRKHEKKTKKLSAKRERAGVLDLPTSRDQSDFLGSAISEARKNQNLSAKRARERAGALGARGHHRNRK